VDVGEIIAAAVAGALVGGIGAYVAARLAADMASPDIEDDRACELMPPSGVGIRIDTWKPRRSS
jgi:hypothetical protein